MSPCSPSPDSPNCLWKHQTPEGSCRACVAPERGQAWSRVGPRPEAEGSATVAATATWRARMLSEEGWVTGDQSLRCC